MEMKKQQMHKSLEAVRKGPAENEGPRSSVMLSFVLIAPLFFAACPKSGGPEGPRGGMSTRPQPTASPAPIPGAVAFNGERAMEHVKKQVEFGPRPPGSPELAKTRAYIIDQLKSYGLKVTTDEFRAATPQGEKNMVNITAELPGESKDVIILSSHYDSKYFKNMRFVGANDPGASVGTLLELARVLAATNPKPKLTYWFAFFDGEEAFCETWEECGKPDAPDNTYGSRHFVEQLRKTNELGRVRAMILLDLMGYKNLELGRDTMSTKWLQNIVWQTARELGYGNVFVERDEGVGGDDHEPFLKAGIDSLDLIQLSNYRYWHTAEDTIDKISPKSMKIVGDVILASLPKIEQYLASHPKS
jgi:glutaminyl-peptide cyclotransferase